MGRTLDMCVVLITYNSSNDPESINGVLFTTHETFDQVNSKRCASIGPSTVSSVDFYSTLYYSCSYLLRITQHACSSWVVKSRKL